MNSELFDQINYEKAYRKNRLNAALWVIDHPETFPELLNYCYDQHQGDLAHKAAWVFEFVCRQELPLLYPHLDAFFKNLRSVKKHQSLRSLSLICELLCIEFYKNQSKELLGIFSEAHKNEMIEASFDWLIDVDQKVACQVRAMTALCYLGKEFDWIHPELLPIIEQNSHHSSAAYKARGRWVLKEIARFRKS